MLTKAIQLDLFDSLKYEGYVFWLKLPSYEIPWMYSEFGFPCSIPLSNELHYMINRGIVKNTSSDRISNTCMTHRTWESEKNKIAAEMRCLWVPIAIPERIYRNGTYYRPTYTWQLSKKAAIDFRNEVRHQFWHSWVSYYDAKLFHAHCNDTHITMDQCMQEWMHAHGISPDEEDVIKRQWRRDRQLMKLTAKERIENTDFNIRGRVNDILNRLRDYKKSGRAQYLRMKERIERQKQK